MITWKSTARLLARSALFPASAITIFGLACRCSSFTQFFARVNVSFTTKKKRKKNDDWCRFYMLHMTGRAIREQSSAAVSEVRNHQPTLEDKVQAKQ